MKKVIFLSFKLLLLTSCLTSKNRAEAKSDQVVVVGEQVTEEQIEWNYELEDKVFGFGDIMSETFINDKNGFEYISPFSKVVWLYSIMDKLNLHDFLSLEAKLSLAESLLLIPKDLKPNGQIYRATAIGNYFDVGVNLVLYSGAIVTSNNSPEGSSMNLLVLGNFKMAVNETVQKFAPKVTPKEFNWGLNGFLFDNGLVVPKNNLSNPKQYTEMLADKTAINYINLIDLYVKDEILENDKDIPELIKISKELADGDNTAILVTKLNKFLYELLIEDLISAESTLQEILSFSREGLSPYLINILDYQVKHMYIIMRHFVNS